MPWEFHYSVLIKIDVEAHFLQIASQEWNRNVGRGCGSGGTEGGSADGRQLTGERRASQQQCRLWLRGGGQTLSTMRRNCKLFIFISCVWTLGVVVYLNTNKDGKVSTECVLS